MAKGDYGDVKSGSFRPKAGSRVFFQRDIFDDTLTLADAHLSIFWRSVKLSLADHRADTVARLSDRLFHRDAAASDTRDDLAVPDHHPVLDQPPDPHLRDAGGDPQRGHHQHAALAARHDRPARSRSCTPTSAILFGMVYVYLPLMVLPLYASMEKLDFRLVEAGYDLYASRFQVLRRIIIPLVKPGIIAGSILVFIPSLGAYVTPRVLGGGKNMMLGNLIELQFGQGRNWPLGAALSITLMVIVMVALLVYVRNAAHGQEAADMASRRILRPPAAGLRQRSRSLCFVAALSADRRRWSSTPSTPAARSPSGRACPALVRRRPGATTTVQEAALRSLIIAISRRHDSPPSPRPWRRSPPRAPAPYRGLTFNICLHQPAADGARNRDRGGAADLLRARSRCRPAIPASAI